MAKWYSEDPEYTQISKQDKAKRDRIIAIMDKYTRDMENYGYFGSNYGMPQDDYEDAAEEIMAEFGI